MVLRTDCEAQYIPSIAYKLRPILIREVRFYWSMDEPVSTFAAQVHQESVWDEDARSPVGASGLAQFMPSTADWISKLYPKDLGENQPLDVRWALRALVMYDKFLYDRVEMDELWEGTLSAYNGGLKNLQRDQKLTEETTFDPRLWWENVELFSNRAKWAFRENRDYVYKILKKWKHLYQREGW